MRSTYKRKSESLQHQDQVTLLMSHHLVSNQTSNQENKNNRHLSKVGVSGWQLHAATKEMPYKLVFGQVPWSALIPGSSKHVDFGLI